MFVFFVGQISERKQNGSLGRDSRVFQVILRKGLKVNWLTHKSTCGQPKLEDDIKKINSHKRSAKMRFDTKR